MNTLAQWTPIEGEPEPPRVLTLTERTQAMSPDEHHYLTHDDNGAQWCDEDRYDPTIEHPAACRYLDRHGYPVCAIGHEVEVHGGIWAAFDVYDAPIPKERGRWRLSWFWECDYWGEPDSYIERDETNLLDAEVVAS
jgi:hypothetical protein